MGAVIVSVLLLLAAVGITGLLVGASVLRSSGRDKAFAPVASAVAEPGPPTLRLVSRVLFATRTNDAIALDCTLVRAEGGVLPPSMTPPVGLPFTVQLRMPETAWFAMRVEDMLTAWAEEERQLVVDLVEEGGRVRATVASGASRVRLELAGAAGLGRGLRT